MVTDLCRCSFVLQVPAPAAQLSCPARGAVAARGFALSLELRCGLHSSCKSCQDVMSLAMSSSCCSCLEQYLLFCWGEGSHKAYLHQVHIMGSRVFKAKNLHYQAKLAQVLAGIAS